eukprot:m.167613 g.167613  ORF g.167613 m.167613 type:complete len:202 (+) comp38936_c2_seq15:232-837(+)
MTSDSARSHSHSQGREEGGRGGQIVMYNRVPKTGSTTFMGLVYALCEKNGFHSIHLNVTGNAQVMSVADQYHFTHNITGWTEKIPGFYHGHVAYIDFPRFGVPQPIYLQIVRDPLERLVSYYYFLRYGDDFRPYLKRSKMGDKTTFDQCVKAKKSDCAPEKLWLQIPFFCGQEPECWCVFLDYNCRIPCIKAHALIKEVSR